MIKKAITKRKYSSSRNLVEIHKVNESKKEVTKYKKKAEVIRLSNVDKCGSFDDEWDNWHPCEG